mgnify:FL=1
MASLVEIYNMSLMMLGGQTVTSVSDTTTRAILCNQFYPFARDATLRAYPWNCARYTQVLSLLVAAPTHEEWSTQFTLPTSPYCLWVPKALNEDLEYEVNGRTLLSNESAVTLNYIRRIDDTGLYDSLLVEALAARLSHNLAYPLTGVASTAELMWKLYLNKIQEARTADGMEDGRELKYQSNSLTEVR